MRSPEVIDDHLDVLADRDCRAAVEYFQAESTESATVEEIAAFVRDRYDRDEADGIAVRLHHSALPRLDDAGLVEYDHRSNTARVRGEIEVIDPLDAVGETV